MMETDKIGIMETIQYIL